MHLQIESVTVLPSNGQHFCIPRRTERLKVTANYCGKVLLSACHWSQKIGKAGFNTKPLVTRVSLRLLAISL